MKDIIDEALPSNGQDCKQKPNGPENHEPEYDPKCDCEYKLISPLTLALCVLGQELIPKIVPVDEVCFPL
jgi:hypothetical protein